MRTIKILRMMRGGANGAPLVHQPKLSRNGARRCKMVHAALAVCREGMASRVPDRARTYNLRLRRPTLYPIELRERFAAACAAAINALMRDAKPYRNRMEMSTGIRWPGSALKIAWASQSWGPMKPVSSAPMRWMPPSSSTQFATV